MSKGKRNKKINQPKNRTFTINMDPRNYTFFDGITISAQGQFQGHKRGLNFPLIGENSFEYGYERESGKKKILTTGPVIPDACFINPSLPFADFDHVFAVDTNTKNIGEDRVSVAAITYCCVGLKNGNQFSLSVPILMAWYEYRNVEGPPENLAWKELIEAILRNPELQKGEIGLIVDSDLGKHKDFNKRVLPIYENFYLPERFRMLYGSTDGGKESLVNKLISFSDKRSNYLLGILEKDDPCKDRGELEGRSYSHFRQWDANFSDTSNHLGLVKI